MPSTPLADRIFDFMLTRHYEPMRMEEIRMAMGVEDADAGEFHDACDSLVSRGKIVRGSGGRLTLPEPPRRLTGVFRSNPKGFGFLVPEVPRSFADLYVPSEATKGAMTGDRVAGEVRKKGKRNGKMLFEAQVTEILDRAQNRFVGKLEQQAGRWYLIPDGPVAHPPILIDDPGAKRAKAGDQVVVEIVSFPTERKPARGVISNVLGPAGDPGVDALGIIEQFQLPQEFPQEVLAEARRMVDSFDPEKEVPGRLDLRDQTVITIDPADARDFDDAISLTRDDRGHWELGVHIADVAHFVRMGGPLDAEARERANSVYLPDLVIPMLPEVLSNGVCSLQEGEPRLTKSVFITLDSHGAVKKVAMANSVISSTRRLSYEQASAALDGKPGRLSARILTLLHDMDHLARIIRQRRLRRGMLVLELPDNELVYDDDGRPVDVVPEDTSFSHTIIEMFMVEANEAVARHLHETGIETLRRIHESSPKLTDGSLRRLVRSMGHELPGHATHRDLQKLLEAVKGRDEAYPVNLAVLRSMEQAEYSPKKAGHFALASDHYCHFTSPIRRYPDLIVHRQLDRLLEGTDPEAVGKMYSLQELEVLGGHCSTNERRAEEAERELKQLHILRLLEKDIGEHYGGIVTGIVQSGIFVQLDRYLIEGMVRFEHLHEDWWEMDPDRTVVVGRRSGVRFRIGDRLTVTTSRIDIARRQLDLEVVKMPRQEGDAKALPRGRHRVGTGGKRNKGLKRRMARRGGGKPSTRRGKKGRR